MRRYTNWLTISACLQLFTAALHAVSLFTTARPQTQAEEEMIRMISTYRLDMDFGFHPTFTELFSALSSCFTLLCLLGGLVNGYLLLKRAGPHLMKGIIGINVMIFGACFAMMAYFTFLLPILSTGLIFACLLGAYAAITFSVSADAD